MEVGAVRRGEGVGGGTSTRKTTKIKPQAIIAVATSRV